jgi:hypothetical protein
MEKKIIIDKISELKDRITFLDSFDNMGGKIWIEQTNGVSRREQIQKLNAQVEVLEEVVSQNQEEDFKIDRTVYATKEIVIVVTNDNIEEYISVLKKFNQDIHKEDVMTKIRFDDRYQTMARFLKYDEHSDTWFVGIYEAKRTKTIEWTPQDLEQWLEQNNDKLVK